MPDPLLDLAWGLLIYLTYCVAVLPLAVLLGYWLKLGEQR